MQSETLSDEGRAARRRMRGDVCGDGGGLGLAPLLVLPRGDATAAALLPFRSVPLSLSLRCDRLAPLVPLAPEEGEGFMCHLFADNTRSQTAQSPFPLSHFGPGKVVDLKIECNIMVDVQMVKMPLLPRLLTLFTCHSAVPAAFTSTLFVERI